MPSAYTYLRELQKKKSSDVLRFLARIRMWQARMEPNIKKLTRPSRTEKARGLGYKRIPGMSIVRCAVRRGGRKRPNSKGIVYGKPKHQGITQLKFKRSLRSTAEERVGRVYANMRVLNSYWVGQVSLFNIRFFSCVFVAYDFSIMKKTRFLPLLKKSTVSFFWILGDFILMVWM